LFSKGSTEFENFHKDYSLGDDATLKKNLPIGWIEKQADAIEGGIDSGRTWITDKLNSGTKWLGGLEPTKWLQDFLKPATETMSAISTDTMALWNEIVAGAKASLSTEAVDKVLQNLKEMVPITAKEHRYIMFEISFSWPEDALSGKKLIFPTTKVTVSVFKQMGIQATFGDLQLAATVGGWESDGFTFSGQMTPKRNVNEATPDVGTIVEFWIDPKHKFDKEFHYLGKITKKNEDVHATGQISYNILVPGLNDQGKFTDKDFSGNNGETAPHEHVDVPYQMVRLSEHQSLLNGHCPSDIISPE